MRLLLDSQVVLWGLVKSPRLSSAAAAAIDDESNIVFVSAVTPYELEWKKAIGKLTFPDIADWPQTVHAADYQHLPVTIIHAQRAALLPKRHRDPWDRLLIAQAQTETLTLVTSDRRIGEYDVATLW